MHPGDQTDISPLLDVLNHFHPLSPGTTDFLKKNVFQLSLGKGEMLLRAGQICENLYFIQKGVVRGFFREGKNEITTWITAENEIATSITSLDLEIPAFENMQVIEDSNFLVLSSAALKTLYEVFPEFNIVGRKILQQYYRDAERRAYFVRLRDAQSKYALFLDYYHHLANRIPLKHIASFLGITMETLSRVRGRMLPNRSSRHKKMILINNGIVVNYYPVLTTPARQRIGGGSNRLAGKTASHGNHICLLTERIRRCFRAKHFFA